MATFTNKKVEELMGTYNLIDHQISTFFRDRIVTGKAPYMTSNTTLVYEQAVQFVAEAALVGRHVEHKPLKLDGHVQKALTPEVLKGSAEAKPDDLQIKEVGTPVMVVNGTKVRTVEYQRNLRLLKIKNAITLAQENMCKGVFLQGQYKSKETGNTVTFGGGLNPTPVTGATFGEFPKWLLKTLNAFNKSSNGMGISEILIGSDLANYLITKYNAISNKMEGNRSVTINKYDTMTDLMSIDLMGKRFTVLPDDIEVNGTVVSTARMFYLYNTNAFLPAYTGVLGESLTYEAREVIVRETEPNTKTGIYETLGESGFVPLLISNRLVNLYNITGTLS